MRTRILFLIVFLYFIADVEAAIIRVTHQGPFINPIENAIHSANDYDTILVMGSVNVYPDVNIITSKKFTLLGPGYKSSLPAVLRSINIKAPADTSTYTINYFPMNPDLNCLVGSTLIVTTTLFKGKTIEDIVIKGFVIKGEINFVPHDQLMGGIADFCLALAGQERVYTKTKFRDIKIENNLILSPINLSYNSARYENFIISGNFFSSSGRIVGGSRSYENYYAFVPADYSAAPSAVSTLLYFNPERQSDSAGNYGHLIKNNIFRVQLAPFKSLYVFDLNKPISIENNIFYSGVNTNQNYNYPFQSNPNPWYIDLNFETRLLRINSIPDTILNIVSLQSGRGFNYKNNIFSRVQFDTSKGASIIPSSFANNLTYQCTPNFPWNDTSAINLGNNQNTSLPIFKEHSSIDSGFIDPYMDFSLAENSPAKSMANDSTDVGIQFDPITGLPISGTDDINIPEIVKLEIIGYPIGKFDVGLNTTVPVRILVDTDVKNIEYFIGNDPGIAAAIPLSFHIIDTLSQGILIEANPNVLNFKGYNNLNFRVSKAAGIWSLDKHVRIFVDSKFNNFDKLNLAECFFNQDPGPGNGFPLQISTSDTIIHIDSILANITSQLAYGIQTFNIRVKNSDGVWGQIMSSPVYIDSNRINLPEINGYEFYFNTDSGIGTSEIISFNSNDTILHIDSITYSKLIGLSPGINTLSVRVKTSNHFWSQIASAPFRIDTVEESLPEISAYEFYFNTDSGPGNGFVMNLSANDTILHIDSITYSKLIGLSPGINTLSVRVKTNNHFWSQIANAPFRIDTVEESLPEISAYEFYFNNDPGPGNGFVMNLSANDTILHIDSIANSFLSQLQSGVHNLNVRVKTSNHYWSQIASSPINVDVLTPNLPAIINLEYYLNSDPGVYAAIPIVLQSQADTIIQSVTIPANTITPGFHTLNLRAANSNLPSQAQSAPIYVSNEYDNLSDFIELNYFVNSDDSIKSKFKFNTSELSLDTTITLQLSNLSNFNNTIYFNAENLDAKPSMFQSANFIYCADTLALPIISGKQSYCIGDTLKLFASTSDTDIVFQWSTPLGVFSANEIQFPVLDKSLEGEYKLRSFKANASACDTSIYASTTIIINDLPRIDSILIFDTLLCSGETTSILLVNDTASRYEWYFNNQLLPDTIFGINVLDSGVYFVRKFNENGCFIDSDPIRIRISDTVSTPQIQIQKDELCLNENLSVLISNFDTNLIYTWITPIDTIIADSLSLTVNSLSMSGDYFLNAIKKNGNRCEISETITFQIQVIDYPIAQQIQHDLGNVICVGDSVNLSVDADTNLRYEWFRNDTLIETNAHQIRVSDSGSYYAIIYNDNNCFISTDTFNLSIKSLPIASEIFGPKVAYRNKSLYTYFNLDTAVKYNWQVQNGTITFNLNNSVLIDFDDTATSAIIQLSIEDSLCSSLPIFLTVDLIQYFDTLMIDVDTIVIPFNSFKQNITIASNINWQITSTENWIDISKLSGNGNDSIEVSVEENSFSNARSADVIIRADTLEHLVHIIQLGKPVSAYSNKNNLFKVFPNPSIHMVYVESTHINLNTANYKLYDSSSRLIREGNFNNNNHSIDVSDVSEGIYFLKIEYADVDEMIKLIVTK